MEIDDDSVEFVGNSTYYYSFTGSPKEVIFNRGIYFVELWGASGATYPYGGKGGYSSGILTILQKRILYLYIGGEGKSSPQKAYEGCISGGWNGGGDACAIIYQNSGGGGTDIRTSLNDEYKDRIIVAGGGGGSSADQTTSWIMNNGGAGGGLIGGNSYGYSHAGQECLKENIGDLWALGGSQDKGGDVYSSSYCKNAYTQNEAGTFGKGGKCSGGTKLCGGGGGGYYGGGGGFDITGGGGGSGYISPGYIEKGIVLNGNSTFPGKNGYETGHVGNGAIRITILKKMMRFNTAKSFYRHMSKFTYIIFSIFPC